MRTAYSTWAHTTGDVKVAIAAYLAALDQEESAAHEYARRIEHDRRFVSTGSDGDAGSGTKLGW